MREIKYLDWCDFCFQASETRTPMVARWTVGMNKGTRGRPPVRVLMVCEQHNQQMEALHAVWSEVGTLPEHIEEPDPRSVGSAYRASSECPVCHGTYSTASLVGHIWGKHRPDERPPFPKVCEVCRHATPTAQGYATHRRLVHQFDAVAEALAGVPGYGHRPVKKPA